MNTASLTTGTPMHHDVGFDEFLARIIDRFTTHVKDKVLFKVDVPDLFSIYLNTIPEVDRQYHNCHECRRFINNFGTLVTIGEQGELHSAVWDEAVAPGYYKPVITALRRAVELSSVSGFFVTSEARLGTPRTGKWTHFSVNLPRDKVHKSKVQTAGQLAAERREEVANIKLALSEWSWEQIHRAKSLLELTSGFQSPEKALPALRWLHGLQTEIREAVGRRVKEHLVWRAVGTAPKGFCYPRAGIVGILMEAVIEDVSVDEIRRRYNNAVHPLAYQRPVAPPKDGTIDQAEKMFEQLNLASALGRRFAATDDIQTWLWQPIVVAPPTDVGTFAHLRPASRKVEPAKAGAQTMTWVRFQRDILPQAESIQVELSRGNMPLVQLVTAVDPDAEPLLAWDRADKRNPVSWYLYHGGSSAASFGVSSGYARVVGITGLPCHWNERHGPNFGPSAILIVEGMQDTRNNCLALFPECLRGELHGVRSVIEAHSRRSKLHGRPSGPSAPAAGYRLDKGVASASLKVVAGGVEVVVKIDRWE